MQEQGGGMSNSDYIRQLQKAARNTAEVKTPPRKVRRAITIVEEWLNQTQKQRKPAA